jgi:hypothetical protein
LPSILKLLTISEYAFVEMHKIKKNKNNFFKTNI